MSNSWYGMSTRFLVGFLAAVVVITALAVEPSHGQEHSKFVPTGSQGERQDPIKIGVLAKRGTERCLEKWTATAEYLTDHIPKHSFTIVPLGYGEVATAVERGEVDFALANPFIYVEIKHSYGASRIATFKNRQAADAPRTVYGGVIFRRADREDIQHLGDLKGKSFMAVDERSFGGWLAAWRELKEHGIAPHRDFSDLRFGGTHDAVVYAVRDGKVDAGTVRTGTLERMAMEGKIRLDDYHALGHDHIGKVPCYFPFRHSTDMYPEWAFAKLRHISDELAEQVAAALLKMPAYHPAAQVARGAGWTVPLNYQPVHDCLKELRVGPYKDFGKVTLGDAVRQYWPVFVAAALFLALATITTLYVLRFNRRLNRAKAELQKAHGETKRLLESIPSVLISVDADDKVSAWNATAEYAFGTEAKDAIGHLFHDLGIEWDHETIAKNISQCRAENCSVCIDEIRFKRPDGTDGFLGITMNPMSAGADQGRGVLLVAADITEQKILQGQLTQAQKLESIGQLAAGISHEINTPIQYVGDNVRFLSDSMDDLLRLIGSYRDLISEFAKGADTENCASKAATLEQEADLPYLEEELPKSIEQSLDGVGRVTKIVRAMKDFSHPGAEGKEAVDLNKAIESTVTVARNEWKYVAEMVTDFDSVLPPVPCQLGEFNQVILNIVINAAHAIAGVVEDGADGKGTITISTRRDGDWAEVRIRDTGTGIPEGHRSKVFDHFFTTKEVGKGTGQGLAIARSVIAEKHGGTITFESEMGKGTTFIIRLPIESKSAATEETPQCEEAYSLRQ